MSLVAVLPTSSGCVNYGLDFKPPSPPSDGFSYYFVRILLFSKKTKEGFAKMKVFEKQKLRFCERITCEKIRTETMQKYRLDMGRTR
jgi:hypothetical protein